MLVAYLVQYKHELEDLHEEIGALKMLNIESEQLENAYPES